ncbi:hypothetical protein [Klebsiella aerogenes]|uniref:hypothetical protein n=1 Tax=Klebsiella aerogenes TaxID=548 RepID=UPI0013A60003|nr:hypothetical protein [Klebsiella aerogenes]HCB2860459.1 hypothetical protein [Klebsiella aerogenes]HCB2881678.1 hypothetical protein [Klebsiella aerogenes]HCM1812527.1 hypothetical protein [Klebsiella aerogenes]HCM7749155.1 hypothetical protein [Klebsiella aerogenes]HDW2142468.1 hypothetical protein [Klebsiella aerogenes]
MGKPGEEQIHFSPLVSLKIALHNTMLHRGLRKVRLAREMALHALRISRLLNVHHASRVEMLEKALHLTGSTVHARVERPKDDAIL